MTLVKMESVVLNLAGARYFGRAYEYGKFYGLLPAVMIQYIIAVVPDTAF